MEAISLAENDNSLRIGLVLDRSDGADALVARPGIRRLSEPQRAKPSEWKAWAWARICWGERCNVLICRCTTSASSLPRWINTKCVFRRSGRGGLFYPVLAHLRERGGRYCSTVAMPGEIVDVLVYREEQHKQHGKRL